MTQSLKKKYKRRRACQLFISCPQTSNQVPSLRHLSSDHQFPPRPLQPPIQSAQPPNLEARMPSPRTAAAKARRSITSSFEEEVGIILSTTFPFCIFQPWGRLVIVKYGVGTIFSLDHNMFQRISLNRRSWLQGWCQAIIALQEKAGLQRRQPTEVSRRTRKRTRWR